MLSKSAQIRTALISLLSGIFFVFQSHCEYTSNNTTRIIHWANTNDDDDDDDTIPVINICCVKAYSRLKDKI